MLPGRLPEVDVRRRFRQWMMHCYDAFHLESLMATPLDHAQ